jgi:uncharacterized membrane protein YfcA
MMDAWFALTGLLLFCAGLLIGAFASAFGTGGGVLNVPLIYLILTRAWGVPDDAAFKSALATSMFTMFFTQLSGGLGHYRAKNYIAGAVPWLAPGAVLGGACGASAAIWLDGDLLKLLFGAFLMLVAWRIPRVALPGAEQERDASANNAAALAGIGFATGFMGSLMGVGGGVVVIPFLVILLGHSFHKAVGTSSILIIFTAAAAFIRFMLKEPAAHLPYSIGFVNLPAAAMLAPGSMLGALAGVRLALRVKPGPLRWAFAIIIAAVALKFLGAYQALARLF